MEERIILNTSTRPKVAVPRRNLKVNDIVIIKEDTLPRNQWQLGRVVETTEGTDGLVRRVKVQVGERKLTQKQNHCSKPSIIERPIQNWCSSWKMNNGLSTYGHTYIRHVGLTDLRWTYLYFYLLSCMSKLFCLSLLNSFIITWWWECKWPLEVARGNSFTVRSFIDCEFIHDWVRGCEPRNLHSWSTVSLVRFLSSQKLSDICKLTQVM